jgi:hypothetical protein
MNIRNVLWVSASVLALGLAFVLPMAEASTERSIPPAVRDIVTQQSHLRAMVAAGRGPFKDLDADEREALLKRQARVLELLDGHGSIDELRVDERIELFNHLQSVKAAVVRAEENRQVCERTRVVGSNRYRVLCMTVEQHRQNKRQSLQSFSSVAPPPL